MAQDTKKTAKAAKTQKTQKTAKKPMSRIEDTNRWVQTAANMANVHNPNIKGFNKKSK